MADLPPPLAETETMDEQAKKYDAFISYSHRDQRTAAAVHRGLHRIGRRMGQLRALRVFRDATDMEVNPDLWSKVRAAMDESRWLVLITSPAATTSTWVNRELAHWIEHRGVERLAVVVASGELAWDETNQRFDPDRSTAAPPRLLEPGTIPTEPLFVDVGGDEPDIRDPLFRERVTAIAAAVHGTTKDALGNEDRRELRRFRRWRRAAVVGLALLAIAAAASAVVALTQRNEAREQRAEAERQRNEAVAIGLAIDATATAQENPALALSLAVEAMAATPEPLPQALDALFRARAATATSWVPIGDPLLGHEDATVQSRFAPDGRYLVTVSQDDVLRIWDPATGDPIGSPIAANGIGRHLFAFGPDGALAFGDLDGDVHVRDIGADVDRLVIRNPGGGRADLIRIGPRGERMVVVWRDLDAAVRTRLQLFDARSGSEVGEAVTTVDTVIDIEFDPTGALLAWTAFDPVDPGQHGTIEVHEAVGGSRLGTLAGHTGRVGDIEFSPDGVQLATSSEDRTVRLWSMIDGTESHLIEPVGGNGVDQVGYDPDGTVLYGAGWDGRLHHWDPLTAEPSAPVATDVIGSSVGASLEIADDGATLAVFGDGAVALWDAERWARRGVALTAATEQIADVDFAPASDLMVTAETDGTVQLWAPVTRESMGATFTDDLGGLRRADVSDNDAIVAATLDGDGLGVWDATTGTLLARIDTGHLGTIRSVAVSPDGSQVATASEDTTVRSWDTDSGNPAFELPGLDELLDLVPVIEYTDDGTPVVPSFSAPEAAVEVAFSPDGDSILTARRSGLIERIDARSGRIVESFGTDLDLVGATWSPDGSRVAVVVPDGVVLVDLESGARVGQPIAHEVPPLVEFSPDGGVLASGDFDGTFRLTDAATATPIGSAITDLGSVSSIAFHPDGELVATSAYDAGSATETFTPPGAIIVWATEDGGEVERVRTASPIDAMVYHPDGELIATSPGSGDVDIRSAASWEPIGEPLAGAGPLESLAFAEGGRWLVTTDVFGTARAWDAPWDTTRACELAAPFVSSAEMLERVPDEWELAGCPFDEAPG